MKMVRFAEQFVGRREAGEQLSEALRSHRLVNPLILGIPRGGVVIAAAVADVLGCDMDVVLTRKIGAPGNQELAVGAVSEDGKLFVNDRIAAAVGADEAYIDRERTCQFEEINRRREQYRRVLPPANLRGRTVVVVDDGVATGATMQAALLAVGADGPSHTIAAVPVGAPDAIERLRRFADEVVCLRAPPALGAIGQYYADFPQVTDAQVVEMLQTRPERTTEASGKRHGEMGG